MAFIFPDDKATFTAPNGITYAWKTDHWVVQKFKGDHEVYVSPTPPDDPQEGKLWYDSSGSVIELFIYVGDTWVSCTPSSEYALEARIAANEESIRDLWTDQQRQDFEIAGIENRVDQLEGKVGEYKYTFQTANPTPRDGQMALLKADMSTTTRWEDVAHIAFNPNSLSGEIFDVSEVVTGDVIRLFIEGDVTMQISAFEAKVVQNDSGILSVSQTVKAVGTGMDGAAYEVEHLSSFDPAGLATMDYVDAQDALLLPKAGGKMEGTLKTEGEVRFELPNGTGGVSRMRLMATRKDENGNGGNSFQFTSHPEPTGILTNAKVHIQLENTEANGPLTRLRFLADPNQDDNAISLGYANDNYLKLSGGTLGGTLSFKRGTKDTQQFKISPNSSNDFATNIYSFNNGQMRFRTTVGTEEQPYETHIIISNNSGSPETRIYKVVTPTREDMAANKAYVDAQAGTPVGSIMIWLKSEPPAGWFKMHGGNFRISDYPQLHAYLQNTSGYVDGVLPDWGGHYPGEYGGHLATTLGAKETQRTAVPDAGPPYPTNQIPNGATRTFTATGNTNAYSNGVARPQISEGWDDVTRPPTVVVHYIIKHD